VEAWLRSGEFFHPDAVVQDDGRQQNAQVAALLGWRRGVVPYAQEMREIVRAIAGVILHLGQQLRSQRVKGAEGGGNLGEIHDSNRYKGDNSSVSQIRKAGKCGGLTIPIFRQVFSQGSASKPFACEMMRLPSISRPAPGSR
jgi:hypothetical protein